MGMCICWDGWSDGVVEYWSIGKMKKTLCVCCLLLTVAFCAHAKPNELNFEFATSKYSQFGFPKSCSAYAVFRSKERTRPMYIYGWAYKGNLKMTFDDGMGAKAAFDMKADGAGTIGLNGYSCTLLQDWKTFTCAPWLVRRPRPIVYVTIKSLRGMSADNKELKGFFKGDRLGDTLKTKEEEKAARLAELKKKPKAVVPKVKAVADLEVQAGRRKVEIKDVPVKMSLGGGQYWSMSLIMEFSFNGADFGWPAGYQEDVNVYMHAEAYAAMPGQLLKQQKVDEKGLGVKETLDKELIEDDVEMGLE